MTVQTRWSLQTMAVVAGCLAVSIGISYAVQLTTARFAAAGWLGSSLTDGLRAAHEPTLSELSTLARELAEAPELLRVRDDAAGSAFVSTRLAQTSAPRFWALLPAGPGGALTSEPSCAGALGRYLGSASREVLVCDGAAMLVAYAPMSGGRWRGLLVGTAMDHHYTDRLSSLYNVEAVLLLGDQSLASSLRDLSNARPRVVFPPGTINRSDAPVLSESTLPLAAYRGFSMGNRATPLTMGSRAHWFISSRRLSRDAPLVLAFLVPVEFMTLGAQYGVFIMMGVAPVLLVLLALLVWRMVGRFVGPIIALSASARAVAGGDLTCTVPVPADSEMGDFCSSYNQMLENMQQLLATQKWLARASGMAEVATGVLHNVGNVLNSINVAASLSLDCADALKLASLERAVALLEQNRDQLGTFISEDPRGRQLLTFFRRLSDELTSERARLRGELVALAQRVDHVKQIVSTQQRYATGAAMLERCSLSALVDEAVRMESTALRRLEIELDCEVADVELNVDRHKMLQVLLNLISNAAQAVSGVASQRLVRVWTERDEEGALRLSVEDNGVGIAGADLPKLFAYGYTTKEDGHGFGLHHSALVAAEIGGTLTAHSDGPGCGAVFVLTLPLAAALAEAFREAS